MSRYTGPVCRLCRREGTKLFLKGEKCFNACVLEKGKRKSAPGMHVKQRIKVSEYGRRLREIYVREDSDPILVLLESGSISAAIDTTGVSNPVASLTPI